MGEHNAAAVDRAAYKPKMRDIGGCQVLLDRDAAEYFEVELKILNAAVKRHLNRFPPDFMVEFNDGESCDREQLGAARGFTEVGVNALAMVLKSKRAIAHSIAIVREGVAAFGRIRSMRA
jgi:hypothetical protein